MVIPTSLPVQLPAVQGYEQEIEIVTWDESGLWKRDTSFQHKP